MLLFDPLKLGSLTLKNRIMMPALTTFYDLEGDERPANFYAEIAMGGVGLIVLGSLQAIFPGRRVAGGLSLNQDADIAHLKILADAIHKNGAAAGAQLGVWNYWAKGGIGAPAEEVSPSGVSTQSAGDVRGGAQQFSNITRPMTIDDIHQIQAEVAESAVRAVKGGCDLISLQSTAGSLPHRFLNPFTNRRQDMYGGSIENRARMLVEMVKAIKQRVGNDFPLICRFPGADLVPWAMPFEDYQQIAVLLEKAGVHAIEINPGWFETNIPRHQNVVPRGAFVYLAEGIKKVIKIPVGTGLRINDPVLAEEILTEKRADFIAMGRPLMADPELPNKARAGRFEDIRYCTACCHCMDIMSTEKPLECSVNARLGREGETVINRAAKPKKVFIVGGGPAGMEAARVAALRGHKVTLAEKSGQLGGELLIAAVPPFKDEWTTTTKFFTTQMKKLGVNVKLNYEVTADNILAEKADNIILATGAVSIIPPIPGIDGKNVVLATDVLAGKATVGQNVVVVGGGLVGAETSEFLYMKGKKVTILEMMPEIARDMGNWTRWPLLQRFEKSTIRVETNQKVLEINEKGVNATREGKTRFFEADTVIVAVGMKADDSLQRSIEGKIKPVVIIGACTQPRKVADAIAEGFQAGFEV